MRLFSKVITFNRIRDGKPGPSLVYAGAWREDITYIKDDVVNHYVHQVRNGKKEFYLLQTPQSLGDDPYLNNTQGSGDIWRRVEQHDLILARKIQADEIDVDDLVVKRMKTMNGGPRIEIHGTVAEFFGRGLFPNIVMGIDSDGYAVLKYFTHDGKLLYDLGPKGIDWNGIEPSRWNSLFFTLVTTKSASNILWIDVEKVIHMDSSSNTEYYKWYAGSNPTISEEDREKEKTIRTSPQHYAGKIPDGWYVVARSYNPGERPLFFSQNTGEYVKPKEKAFYPNKRGVVDRGNIYYEIIYQMIDGVIADEYYVMWNGDENGNQIWP